MPNVTGITFKEAKQKLKDAGIETNSNFEADTIITNQLPKEGINIETGTKVILYGEQGKFTEFAFEYVGVL